MTHPVDEVMRFFAMVAAYGSDTYATSVPAMHVLLHLGGRHSLQCTKQRTRLAAQGNEEGLSRARQGWESGKAPTTVGKLLGGP